MPVLQSEGIWQAQLFETGKGDAIILNHSEFYGFQGKAFFLWGFTRSQNPWSYIVYL